MLDGVALSCLLDRPTCRGPIGSDGPWVSRPGGASLRLLAKGVPDHANLGIGLSEDTVPLLTEIVHKGMHSSAKELRKHKKKDGSLIDVESHDVKSSSMDALPISCCRRSEWTPLCSKCPPWDVARLTRRNCTIGNYPHHLAVLGEIDTDTLLCQERFTNRICSIQAIFCK